jgi:two-component system chemotaxis sensor kinase CheA
VRDDYLPVVALDDLLNVPDRDSAEGAGLMVTVEAEGRRIALRVDELLGQQQVVVKNLENNYRRVDGISGATILGDGRVALIVDVGGLVRSLRMPQAA